MKAIQIKVEASDKDKIDLFVGAINTNEGMVAIPIKETAVYVAAIGERGIAYAKSLAIKTFDGEVKIVSIK